MARGLAVDETVYVPVRQLENLPDQPSAFFKTKVLELNKRSVRVEVFGDSQWVASSKCQRNIGLLVLNFGDLQSESTLLDPLSKSLLQFCRLLASDSYVDIFKVRSLAELKKIWELKHPVYSHVLMIGHGNGTGMKLAVDAWCGADDFEAVFDVEGVTPKLFVSLACEAGKAGFGQGFSQLQACDVFLGAFDAVHGAIASQFVQSFLVLHMLHGETSSVAFRHARRAVWGTASFRLWREARLTTE